MPFRKISVKCPEDGLCFAHDASRRCRILSEGYQKGECPFKKPIISVTNGKDYPYDAAYKEAHGL